MPWNNPAPAGKQRVQDRENEEARYSSGIPLASTDSASRSKCATFGNADSFDQLIAKVEHKIFGALPDDTWFYPGHGNDSTLGAERPHLAGWRARGW